MPNRFKPISDWLYCSSVRFGSVCGFGFSANKSEFRTSKDSTPYSRLNIGLHTEAPRPSQGLKFCMCILDVIWLKSDYKLLAWNCLWKKWNFCNFGTYFLAFLKFWQRYQIFWSEWPVLRQIIHWKPNFFATNFKIYCVKQ